MKKGQIFFEDFAFFQKGQIFFENLLKQDKQTSEFYKL